MNAAEKARRDARIIRLQAALFDHTSHIWRGLSKDEVRRPPHLDDWEQW